MLNYDNHDRVTIGLYSVQKGKSFNEKILYEIPNILGIKEKFSLAATERHRKPPEIVVSILLIPDWDQNFTFQSHNYVTAINTLMKHMITHLTNFNGITVENFYEKPGVSTEEKEYLEGLVAKGSNADMIKNHAIFCEDNKNRSHLQMDSNTQIHDYQGLYDVTFAADNQPTVPLLNASYYDKDYVSAHNKIVYTGPKCTDFRNKLCSTHITYCGAHRNDHINPGNEAEKTTKNSIYSKDFVVALSQINLTVNFERDGKQLYAANMNDQLAYTLTKFVVTAVNMSWVMESRPQEILDAMKLPKIRIRDAWCDYASFCMAIKKFTKNLSLHNQVFDDLAPTLDDTAARNRLLELSNTDVDKAIIIFFYFRSIKRLMALNNLNDTRAQDTMNHLVELFPRDPRGRDLVNELFSVNVNVLHYIPEAALNLTLHRFNFFTVPDDTRANLTNFNENFVADH